MPHPWPCASPPPEQAFLGWPENCGSQKTSLSVLPAVRCLISQGQVSPPHWENSRCPKTQPQSPPGIKLRGYQRKAAGVAGLGGSQGTGRALLPLRWFPRVVSSRQTHTAVSLMGFQYSFPLQHCSWEGQSHK